MICEWVFTTLLQKGLHQNYCQQNYSQSTLTENCGKPQKYITEHYSYEYEKSSSKDAANMGIKYMAKEI